MKSIQDHKVAFSVWQKLQRYAHHNASQKYSKAQEQVLELHADYIQEGFEVFFLQETLKFWIGCTPEGFFYRVTFSTNYRAVALCEPISVEEAAVRVQALSNIHFPREGYDAIIEGAGKVWQDASKKSVVCQNADSDEEAFKFFAILPAGDTRKLEPLSAREARRRIEIIQLAQEQDESEKSAAEIVEHHHLRLSIPFVVDGAISFRDFEAKKAVELFDVVNIGFAAEMMQYTDARVSDFVAMAAWAAYNYPDKDIEAVYYGPDSELYIGDLPLDDLFNGIWTESIVPFRRRYAGWRYQHYDRIDALRQRIKEVSVPKAY